MSRESERRATLHRRTLVCIAELRETIDRLEAVLNGHNSALPGFDAFELQRDLTMARQFFLERILTLTDGDPRRLLSGGLKDAARAEWTNSLDIPAAVIAKKYMVSVGTLTKLFGRRTTGDLRRQVPEELSVAIEEALQDDKASDIEIARAIGANSSTVRLYRFKKLVASADPKAIAKALHKKTAAKLRAMPDIDAFEDVIPILSPLRRYSLVELMGKGTFKLTELGRLVKAVLSEINSP